MVNVATALSPASATARWPPAKVMPNGTLPGSAVTAGVADSPPEKPMVNTSMSLPLPLVVTISRDPSWVNATCPGVWVNSGVSVGSRRSGRFQDGTRTRVVPTRRNPCTDPPPRALST